jgi:hypothetical protein
MRNGEADSAQAHQRINASSGILAAQRMGWTLLICVLMS